jgi:FkbM family methyltransferase
MPLVSKPVFALANVLFRYCYPLYKASYYTFKRRRDVFEISLLQKYLKKGDTALDIGANIGFYSEILSAIVGDDGEVHAFEPDPINVKHLRASCADKRNIVINNTAVGNHVGELTLFTSRLGNVDHRSYPTDDFETSFTVRTDTIDNYLNGRKVAFIKMDIQGAEFFALQGMTRTLDANHDVIILTEFWPFALKEAGTSVEAVQSFLCEKGFLVYRVGEDRLEQMDDLVEYFYRPKAKYDDLNLLFTRNAL